MSWILLRRYAGVQELHNKKIHTKQGKNSSSPFFYAITGAWLSSYYNLARALVSFFPGQNEEAAKGPQQHGKPNPTTGTPQTRAGQLCFGRDSPGVQPQHQSSWEGGHGGKYFKHVESQGLFRPFQKKVTPTVCSQAATAGSWVWTLIVLFPAFFRRPSF